MSFACLPDMKLDDEDIIMNKAMILALRNKQKNTVVFLVIWLTINPACGSLRNASFLFCNNNFANVKGF